MEVINKTQRGHPSLSDINQHIMPGSEGEDTPSKTSRQLWPNVQSKGFCWKPAQKWVRVLLFQNPVYLVWEKLGGNENHALSKPAQKWVRVVSKWFSPGELHFRATCLFAPTRAIPSALCRWDALKSNYSQLDFMAPWSFLAEGYKTEMWS